MVDKSALVDRIVESQGRDEEAVLANAALDSVVPGGCVYCGFIVDEIEPDQDRGYCEGCGAQGVQSILVLKGWI